ncbi:hypothetical protein [Saccharothrix sp. HUAS TT1]|uniref:hypothetical protein n=1 Tax=unclassified Saccharothrix TaxID=2593673 RepID=UPI00345C074F
MVTPGSPLSPAPGHDVVQRSLRDRVDEYATYAHQLANDPPKPGAKSFHAKLLDWVTERLVADGVPTWTRVEDSALPSGKSGAFDHVLWKVKLPPSKQLYRKAINELGADAVKGYTDTLFHEAYHCEQYFTVAKLLASRGIGIPEIMGKLVVPRRVAEAAVRAKGTLDGEGAAEARSLAERWEPWTTGPVHDWLNAVLKLKNLSRAARAAQDKSPDTIQKEITALLAGMGDCRDKVVRHAAEVTGQEADVVAAETVRLREACAAVEDGRPADGSASARAEFVREGGPVAALNTIAHHVYQEVDPLEKDAWALGALAGEAFALKAGVGGGTAPPSAGTAH